MLFLVPAISQTHKSLENSQDFFCQNQDQDLPQDQDQDSGSQDQDQDFIFCPRGASRPRLVSRTTSLIVEVAKALRGSFKLVTYTVREIT